MFTVKVDRKAHGKGIAGISSLHPGPNAVKVGLPSGEADQDVINRAIWNEFGTKGGGWGGPIPERPFLRNAMRNNRGRYRELMRSASKTVLLASAEGREKMIEAKRRALAKLGVAAQGDIQAEITSLSSPINSPVTVKLKGSSNPLIDSGEMRQAITFKVED